MDAVRAGKLGDTIVSFVPTQAHIKTVSLLELNFSENLLLGLRQAVEFLSRRLEQPSFAGLSVSYNRIADIVITVLEIHSLFLYRSSSATAGERYMGLKRLGGRGNMTQLQKLLSLVEAVVIPYVMNENKYNEKSAVKGYRVLKSMFSLCYLLGLSDAAMPLQYIARIRIVRHFDPPPSHRPRTWKDRFRNLPSILVWGLVYSIQFFQWYFAHQEVLRPKPKGFAIQPPPELSSDLVDLRLCPLCRRPRTNPTALLSNGRVYCYSCIANKLDDRKSISILTRRLVE